MVKVLHELGSLDGGGVEGLLYNYYTHMDHDVIHFDFVISDDIDNGILERPLREMGCNIYKLPSLKKDMKRRMKTLDKILSDGNYDIVHSHIARRSAFILSLAKKHDVKIRIAHSHSANYETGGYFKRAVDYLLVFRAKQLATDLFACGDVAARYTWGSKNRVNIMRNAIDTESFRYNSEERNKIRHELGLEGKTVIGTVGRLSPEKNQAFLLDVFKKITEENPNLVLVIIGRGPLEEELQCKAKDLHIDSKVYFLGVRNDVNKLLNGIDIFVLPSLYEGLPLTMVEAQTNGLPILAADTIPIEGAVTDLVEFLPLNIRAWEAGILRLIDKKPERERYQDQVKKAGYDIKNEAIRMQQFYLEKIM